MEHILGFDQNLARMSTFIKKLMQSHVSHGSSLKLNRILANLLILYTETSSVRYYIWHFACFLMILWLECQNISKTLTISLFRINVIHFEKKVIWKLHSIRDWISAHYIYINIYTLYMAHYLYSDHFVMRMSKIL